MHRRAQLDGEPDEDAPLKGATVDGASASQRPGRRRRRLLCADASRGDCSATSPPCDAGAGDACLPPRRDVSVIVALLALATATYLPTLEAIPNPDWLVANLPRLITLITIAVAAVTLTPIFAALRPLPPRARAATLAATLSWIACAAAVDHGGSLSHHGAYNLLILLLVAVPTWTVFAAGLACKAALGGRRASLLTGVVLLVLSPGWAAYRLALGEAWTGGLLGRRLVGAGQPLADGWSSSVKGGAVSLAGVLHRHLRRGGDGGGKKDKRTGLASPPASMPSTWTGCDWPLSSSWVPLYDVLPAGAQNFWLGDWQHCPPKSDPAFAVSVALGWGAVTADDVAAGARNCGAGDTHPRAPGSDDASPPPPPGAAGPWVPATLTITCPPRHAVRLFTVPDTQSFDHATRRGDALQPAVLSGVDASLQVLRPASPHHEAAAELTHTVPSNVFGETFVVECGADNSTVTINRPSLPVLLRSAAQWGAHSPIAELLKPQLPAGAAPLASTPARPLNVLVIFMDSVSRINAHRRLPKTLAVLEELAGRPRRHRKKGAHKGAGAGKKKGSHGGGKGHGGRSAAQLSEAAEEDHAGAVEARAALPAEGGRAAADGDAGPHQHGDHPTTTAATALSAPTQHSRLFEFFRYHSVGTVTHVTVVPAFTGRPGGDAGREPLWETARRAGGYVSAYVNGMCEDMSSNFFDYKAAADHESFGVACLPDTLPPMDPCGIVGGPYSAQRRCHGDQYEHRTQLAFGRSFWANYAGVPKYLHLGFLEGHEPTSDVLGLIDADLAAFITHVMLESSAAENTALVLMADHGLHMGLPVLWTAQGKFEHMMPALFVALPAGAAKDEAAPLVPATALDAAELNQQYLVGSYEVYWTLRAVIAGNSSPASDEELPTVPAPLCATPDYRPLRPARQRASRALDGATFLSVFEPLPMNRTCADAHILAAICKCL